MVGPLGEQFGIVYTLSPTKNLLATHEHVVGVGGDGVVGVGHGVERPDRQRVLVEDIKVGVVFGLHQSTQKFLRRRTQVLFFADNHARLFEHFSGLGVLEHQWRFQESKRFN